MSEVLAQVLVRRGLADAAAARAFLHPDFRVHDPYSHDGHGRRRGARIDKALRRDEPIAVHGDYDADGITATFLLVRVLGELGADVRWRLPQPFHGRVRVSRRRRWTSWPRPGSSCLITVDCGITARDEVARAGELGMDVIVTDHHEMEGTLPGCIVVTPKLDGVPVPPSRRRRRRLQAGARAASRGPGDDLVELPAGAARRSPTWSPSARSPTWCRSGRREPRARHDRSGTPAQRAATGLGGAHGGRRGQAGDRPRRRRRLSPRAAPQRCRPPRRRLAGARTARLRRSRGGPAAGASPERAQPRAPGHRGGDARGGRRHGPGPAAGGSRALVARTGTRASSGSSRRGSPSASTVRRSCSARATKRPRAPGAASLRFDLLGAVERSADHLLTFGGHRAACGLRLRREAHRRRSATPSSPRRRRRSRRDDLLRARRVDAVVGGHELTLGLADDLELLAPHGFGNREVTLLLHGAEVVAPRLTRRQAARAVPRALRRRLVPGRPLQLRRSRRARRAQGFTTWRWRSRRTSTTAR